MYSAKIDGAPTTFGTSGLLYRSNKLMYDRTTESIWHQFTGEPVIGPLANSGIKLPFFPVILTTWKEWLDEHPDTTVLSNDTGVYEPAFYEPEESPRAIYNDYFTSPDTRFPVWRRSDILETKEIVLALGIDDSYKAYPVKFLQKDRIVNDVVGGSEVVVISALSSEAARVYERAGRSFSLPGNESPPDELPAKLTDADGGLWLVTEEYLVSEADPEVKLPRVPTHMSFWFGWFSFHPETAVYMLGGG